MSERQPGPRSWAGQAGVIATQGAVTLTGALAGLLIVRGLPPESYALYTVALAVLGAISLLADSGTTMGALAEGGKVWRDPRALGGVLRAAWAWRNRLAAWTGALAAPVLVILLRKHGASWTEVVGWAMAVGLMFWINLRGSLLEVPLRLHQRLRVTQGVAIEQALLRLGGVAVAVAAWPAGIVVALAGGLPQLWANRRLAKAGVALASSEVMETRHAAAFSPIVRRSLPGAVYHIVSQQAAVWFLTIGGTTVAVAQLGAISRIGLLLSVIGALAQAVWVPRFARMEAGAGLRAAYAKMLGAAGVLCLPLAAFAWVWPEGLLWLVGPSYAGLEGALRLAVVAAASQVLGGVALALGYGRGWLPPPALSIGAAFVVQAGCVVLGDLSTLIGVLWMGVFLGAQSFLVHSGYLIWKTRRTTC